MSQIQLSRKSNLLVNQKSVQDEIELRWGKKEKSTDSLPKNPPKNIVLPGDDSRGPPSPIVWTKTGRRGNMKQPKRSAGKILIPGWLIELSEDSLSSIRIIKEMLAAIKDVQEADLSFESSVISRIITDDLGFPIDEFELEDILRKTPFSVKIGVNFTHFMYAMADPDLIGIDHIPYTVKSKGLGPDVGYTDREKFFFTGIFIFQMYDLVQQIKDIFDKGPVPRDKADVRREEEARGHGVNTIGIKNPKKAEWDKFCPSMPKVSPYLARSHFVTTRRTFKETLHDHFVIQPPPEGKGTITLQENRQRVVQALRHIFMAKPAHDCVCILPDIQYLFKFTEPIAKTLEGIARERPKKKPVVNHFEIEMQRITKELKYIFRPVGLPKQFDFHRNLISTSMFQEIRGFLGRIHDAHWENLKDERVEFLNQIWKGIEAENIPNRTVQNTLYLAFTALLPYHPHITSIRTPTLFIRRPYQQKFGINYL